MTKIAEPIMTTPAVPEQKAQALRKSPTVRNLERIKYTLFQGDDAAPRQLYHYTTASGMLGILRSGQLWATNISYLNDYSEVQYGYEVLREAAAELKPAGELSSSFFAELFTAPTDVSDPSEVYVSCFCEEPDILSQWRAYGDETGYCIGMHLDAGKSGQLKPPGTTSQCSAKSSTTAVSNWNGPREPLSCSDSRSLHQWKEMKAPMMTRLGLQIPFWLFSTVLLR